MLIALFRQITRVNKFKKIANSPHKLYCHKKGAYILLREGSQLLQKVECYLTGAVDK